MMDFYSMEKIAYAKIAEERETAAGAHRAAAVHALRTAARVERSTTAAALFRGLARLLVHPVLLVAVPQPRPR